MMDFVANVFMTICVFGTNDCKTAVLFSHRSACEDHVRLSAQAWVTQRYPGYLIKSLSCRVRETQRA